MIEEFLERQTISKRKWLAYAGIAVAVLVVMGVGLNTIISGVFFKGPHAAPKPKATASPSSGNTSQSGTSGGDEVGSIDDASFGYLIPSTSKDWNVQTSTEAYDSKKGLVKYSVKLSNAGTMVTVSQQPMPASLLPRGSSAFDAFIDSNKPVRNDDVGDGKLYFLPALQNGVPANGSDTVIYATDAVLLFGRAERVVGYDGWTKLIETMRPH